MKLYNIPQGSKIYEETTDGSKFLILDHIDGMYSYCKTENGNVVNLGASTPLIPFEDGYKFEITD